MKLAFSTLGCPEWSLQQAAAHAERMGFQAIELRGIRNRLNADEIPELSEAGRESTGKLLAERNLSVCCLDCSASFDNDGAVQRALSEAKAAVRICGGMQIPYLRVFGDRIAAGESEEQACRRAASGIRQICDDAAECNVTVLLETHGDYSTEARLKRTAELVSRPNFGLLWDIEHTAKTFRDRNSDFAELFFPLIRHVHLKDAVLSGRTQPELCLPGKGELPIAEIVRRLLRLGYDGYFSFEWEKRWIPSLEEPEEAFPAFAEYMRSIG